MKCPYHALISDALDEQLSSEQQKQIQEHFICCSECSEYFQSMKKLKMALGSLPKFEVPINFPNTVEAYIAKRKAGTLFLRHSRLAWAAVILVSVALPSLWLFHAENRVYQSSPVPNTSISSPSKPFNTIAPKIMPPEQVASEVVPTAPIASLPIEQSFPKAETVSSDEQFFEVNVTPSCPTGLATSTPKPVTTSNRLPNIPSEGGNGIKESSVVAMTEKKDLSPTRRLEESKKMAQNVKPFKMKGTHTNQKAKMEEQSNEMEEQSNEMVMEEFTDLKTERYDSEMETSAKNIQQTGTGSRESAASFFNGELAMNAKKEIKEKQQEMPAPFTRSFQSQTNLCIHRMIGQLTTLGLGAIEDWGKK